VGDPVRPRTVGAASSITFPERCARPRRSCRQSFRAALLRPAPRSSKIAWRVRAVSEYVRSFVFQPRTRRLCLAFRIMGRERVAFLQIRSAPNYCQPCNQDRSALETISPELTVATRKQGENLEKPGKPCCSGLSSCIEQVAFNTGPDARRSGIHSTLTQVS
jgi:hypothetical protein